jgi:hypothetical protein
MFKIQKLSEFEKGYMQKSGTPENHAEIIRTINLLIDMVNSQQKEIEKLSLQIQEVQNA